MLAFNSFRSYFIVVLLISESMGMSERSENILRRRMNVLYSEVGLCRDELKVFILDTMLVSVLLKRMLDRLYYV